MPRARSDDGWLRSWLKSWRIRRGARGYKLNFDLHRAAGLWFLGFLIILAWSSVALNLPQVYRPVTAVVLGPPVELSPAALREPLDSPPIDMRAALELARSLARAKASTEGFAYLGETMIAYDPGSGTYHYRFQSDIDVRDDYGTVLTFSAVNGTPVSWSLGNRESLGKRVTLFITALHMNRIGGLPVQLLLFVSGIAIAVLSVTGLIIWWKKRAARVARNRKPRLAPVMVGETAKLQPSTVSAE